jgi:hypothetical protein
MDAVALYGAGLSTALLVWEIYKYAQDRPKLSIKCFVAVTNITFRPIDSAWGVTFEDDGQPTNDNPFLAYRVTNVGSKEVVVVKVGGGFLDGKTFSADYDTVKLPRRLAPADYFQYAAPPDVVRRDLKFLGVWDSSGKMWKAPRRQVKRVIAQADELNPTSKTG